MGLKKLSTESLKKRSSIQSKGSKINITKNVSQEDLKNIYQQGDDTSPASSQVNKQQMQDYLISQVLFDGKEDVKSSRMALTHKQKLEDEEKAVKERLQEKENKRKEIEMVNKEYELRKK